MTLRLVTVVGARPEFVQVGTIARAIEAKYAPTGLIEHLLVHTGQHHDKEMSDVILRAARAPSAGALARAWARAHTENRQGG